MPARSNLNPKPRHFVTDDRSEYHATILANRLKTNYRHWSRRYKREAIEAFRLYDRDIPEVRAVVDWYAGHLVVGEYVRLQTPPTWLPRMAKAAGDALGVAPVKVFIKQRRTKVDDKPRYPRLKDAARRFAVRERELRFWVDLDTNLDTGLFSDHRETRVLVRDMAKGKDFLNLYAYTGSFSCAAAAGGARSVVTVDRSAAAIRWARDNFALNNLKSAGYEFITSDAQEYLEKARSSKRRFDLCFVDPPSFSRRKGPGTFDVNKHHVDLLKTVCAVMNKGATVIFAANHQRFDPKLNRLGIGRITELTPATIPGDYRNKLVHRCWRIDL